MRRFSSSHPVFPNRTIAPFHRSASSHPSDPACCHFPYADSFPRACHLFSCVFRPPLLPRAPGPRTPRLIPYAAPPSALLPSRTAPPCASSRNPCAASPRNSSLVPCAAPQRLYAAPILPRERPCHASPSNFRARPGHAPPARSVCILTAFLPPWSARGHLPHRSARGPAAHFTPPQLCDAVAAHFPLFQVCFPPASRPPLQLQLSGRI